MKNKITQTDYIKAHRKASREEEIRLHGRPLPRKRVHKSKKAYDRNSAKADLKRLPFLLPAIADFNIKISIFAQYERRIHTIESRTPLWRKNHIAPFHGG